MTQHDTHTRARVAILDWPGLADTDEVLGNLLALLGGLERFVRPGRYVLVKPNLVAGAPPESGGTTHVELIEALVRRIQRLHPGRLVVAEGAAVADPPRTFELLGYRAMADRCGIELIDLDHAEHDPCPLPDPKYPGVLMVARPILECDVLISVGCLKTHINAGITVALKNAFGTISQADRTRIHREYRLEECFCDLCRIRKPDLVLIDGLVGADGVAGGADFSRPANARLMLASDNPVAMDAIGARVMRQDTRIRSIDWAAEYGMGPNDPAEIEVVGLTVEQASRPYLSPAAHLAGTMKNLDLVDLGSCTGCRTILEPALSRYRGMELARPLRVVLGGEGRTDEVAPSADGGALLVVGDCARGLRHDGTFIPGCPPQAEEIHTFLRSSGLACQRCHPALRQVLAEIEGTPLHADLRALCGGELVHQGANNQARPADLGLLVGDCMAHYYHNSRKRADQVLGGRSDNVVLVPGCPPTLEAVREGLAQVRAVAERRAAGAGVP